MFESCNFGGLDLEGFARITEVAYSAIATIGNPTRWIEIRDSNKKLGALKIMLAFSVYHNVRVHETFQHAHLYMQSNKLARRATR